MRNLPEVRVARLAECHYEQKAGYVQHASLFCNTPAFSYGTLECVRATYTPPPNLGCPEGNTEVDVTIIAEKAVIFVEAKYHSEIDTCTTHCSNRDQIKRNIDVGTYYAWNTGLDFYFVLLI